MSLFKSFLIDVVRRDGGSYDDDGNWVGGTPVTFQIKSSIQPLRGEDMESLPEARRKKATYKIYPEIIDKSFLPLGTVDEDNPDELIIYGRTYEIYRLENCANDLINHQKAFLGLKTNL